MPSLSAKDRVSLCSFTFSDGRRCRSPRTGKQSRFCFDHAQKEARAQATESLSKDLSYFFSGTYLSACDLSTAMGRLIPAVIRGDVKPKVARTVAYMAQTLLQSIRMSQDEYINAFGTDGWRKSIGNSVNGNLNYRFPPAPEREQPESPQSQPQPQPRPQSQPAQPQTQAQQPAPAPHTSLPLTSAEFVQRVVAGLQTGGGQAPKPAPATRPAPAQTPSTPTPPTPAPAPSPTSIRASQTPASPHNPNHPASTIDKPQPPPATQSTPPSGPTCQPVNPTPPRPSTGPSRDTPWWNFGDTGNIPPDSHLL